MREEIRLDTMSDIHKFVDVASNVPETITLEDGLGHCVSARSLLGVLYTFEWTSVYCVCEKDITAAILPWLK